MEQIKPNYFGGANFEARTVKDIIEPAKSISNKVSVRAALDQMQAQATDSSPVVDQCGELLGILSKNKMNRNVGGFGHDPKTEPVEAHIEKNNAYCFEDQTIAEAEQMMLNAKLGEVFVVTREKLLVGTINIEAIAQEGKKLGSRLNSESLRRARSDLTLDSRYRYRSVEDVNSLTFPRLDSILISFARFNLQPATL